MVSRTCSDFTKIFPIKNNISQHLDAFYENKKKSVIIISMA